LALLVVFLCSFFGGFYCGRKQNGNRESKLADAENGSADDTLNDFTGVLQYR
jgi:hypothetical protein